MASSVLETTYGRAVPGGGQRSGRSLRNGAFDMTQRVGANRFLIDSLARTGSTSLARLLSCHPDIECLIEPFHPSRYGGHFHRMAVEMRSAEAVLDLIYHRWTGIKHVWEASGWPFDGCAELNEDLLLRPNTKVIFLCRRNLLRRFVSNLVSRHLRFWIGTKEEFRSRLQQAQFKELNAQFVRDQIRGDQKAIRRRLQVFSDNKVQMMPLYYEDLFNPEAQTVDRLTLTNSILRFLGFRTVLQETFEAWLAHFDPDTNRWASPETYRLIPGIERIERDVGTDETGWLFR